MEVLDLLMQMDPPVPDTRLVKVKRLSKLCAEDVVFELQGLSYSRVAEIKSKHGDDLEMDVHITLAGVLSPNLRDAGLMQRYGAVTPAELVKKLLLPGEIVDLSRQIEKLSGYRVETISEVKKN